MTIQIGLCGAKGKMGLAISQKIASLSGQCQIQGTFTRQSSLTDLIKLCQESEVIIDFSSPDLLVALVENAIKYQTKLVIGTTGLKKVHLDLLKQAAQQIAIVYSANMSIGANLLAILTRQAATILDNDYDIEIIDYHHRDKLDAPSGTALMLGRVVSETRNLDFEQSAIFDRATNKKRKDNQIGFASIRAGGIYGEHDVIFASVNEVITLKHQMLNRESFADGAVKAALWIASQRPNLYSMSDVANFIISKKS